MEEFHVSRPLFTIIFRPKMLNLVTNSILTMSTKVELVTIFIIRIMTGGGGPEDGYSPLLYVIKYPYAGGLVVLKSLETHLHNIKMVPYSHIVC